MQLISGFLELLAPYGNLLWLIPAALSVFFVGWVVRGVELGTTLNQHQDAISSRDLKLKKMGVHLEKKQILLDQVQTDSKLMSINAQEIEQNQALQNKLESTRDELKRSLSEKKAIEQNIDDKVIELEKRSRRLARYERATREYEEKFSALKTKYKQRDAKLYGEIVELRAYIFDLKARNLQTEKERNQFRDSTLHLQQTDAESQSSTDSIKSELKLKEDEVVQLKLINQEQAAELQEELAHRQEKTEQLNDELEKEREAAFALTEKLEQITQKSIGQLERYDSERKSLGDKLKNVQDEYRKEKEARLLQNKEIEPLTTINKNQARTIQSLEGKLHEQRKNAEKFQSMAADILSARSELEKTRLQGHKVQAQLQEQSLLLNTASDQLQQSKFENRKINSLRNQLNEKHSQLKQYESDIVVLKRELTRSDERKQRFEVLLESKAQLQKKIDDQQNEISDLNVELANSKKIEDKLAEKDIQIGKLSVQITELNTNADKLESRLGEFDQTRALLQQERIKNRRLETRNAQIAELNEEIAGQKQTIAQINKSLTSYRQKADKVSEKDKGLAELESRLNMAQKTINERNIEIRTLKEHGDKSELAERALKTTVQTLEERTAQIDPLQQALVQSEKKALSFSEKFNALRVKMADATPTEAEIQELESFKHALDESENQRKTLNEQIKQLQAEAIASESLRQELQNLAPLKPALEQAENKVKELQACLQPLQQQADADAAAQESLRKSLASLEPLMPKLSVAENTIKDLEGRLLQLHEKAQADADRLLSLQQQAEKGSTANKTLAARIEALQLTEAQLQESQIKVASLSTQMDEQLINALTTASVKEELDALKPENQRLREQLRSLNNAAQDAEQLKEELAHLRPLKSRLIAAQKENDEQSARINALQAAHDKLARTSKEGSSELQAELQQLRALPEKLENLRQEAQHLASELAALQPVRDKSKQQEEQIKQLRTQLQESHATEKALTDAQAEIKKLQTTQQQLHAEKTNHNELEAELQQLRTQQQQISKLQSELDELRPMNARLQEKDKIIGEIRRELEALHSAETDPAEDANESTELKTQIESLMRERDLGLERVKELSETARTLVEREKTIALLKGQVANEKVNVRELNTLRNRIEKQELELHTKTLTIEDLKKMLKSAQTAKKPRKASAKSATGNMAKGPAVKKTPVQRSAALRSNARKPASKNSVGKIGLSGNSATGKDDLKKINGIGPVLEKLLNDIGITSFQQIASFSQDDIEEVTAAIDTFPGRVTRDNWIGGAQAQYKNKSGGKNP